MVLFHNINLKSIHCFVMVVESGGFSQAQNVLHMSAGTVSNHITALEQKLGYRLCERGPKGFSLTENGEVFYENAITLLQHTHNFWTESQELYQLLQGTLHIGCMDMTHTDKNNKIEAVLHTIRTEKPDIKFHLEYTNHTHLENAILNETMHLAFSISPQKNSLLDYITLYQEQCYLYAGKNHPLFAVDDVHITDAVLGNHMFSTRSFDMEYVPKTETFFESSNAEAHLAYIKSGVALGILPEHVAQPYCAMGVLRPIRPNDIHHTWDINLIFKRTKQKKRLIKYAITTICNIYNIPLFI